MKIFVPFIISILLTTVISAQDSRKTIQDFLEQNRLEQNLTRQDITNWIITDRHVSTTSQVTHVYIQQTHQGIPVSNGLANFGIKDNKVLSMGNRLVDNLAQKITSTSPNINAKKAIELAIEHLNITVPKNLKIAQKIDATHFIYTATGVAQKPIPVRLMYHAHSETVVKLVWDLSIYTLDSKHWWSIQIDANDGNIVQQNDWVINCSFNHNVSSTCLHTQQKKQALSSYPPILETILQPDQYTVFALPVESPNHGTRSTVTNPANGLASPYGWHDTNGVVGAEYTITRGNNVYAYEDADSNNISGFSPDGSALLEFNFPYSSGINPSLYQAAAITNLFYMNNMMHDIWYQYGFTETSGNFQNNNYGRGGISGDEVLAEAQDSANMNNANFAAPPDGNQPRMQLFLWNGAGSNLGNYLNINSPSNLSGPYTGADATFGPGLPSPPVSGDLVLAVDNVPPINDACETIVNSAALFGNIALIDLDNCNFVTKVEAAQNAGAIAVIIINNNIGTPFQMLGNSTTINIPSIMISQSDGVAIKNQLSLSNINATISNGGFINLLKDSDLDNGIIAHEYGHGISQRLAGGPNNVNCLNNFEQMGEGWSDWFGLMLTIEPGDQGADPRGIGTYVSSQPTIGQGLRPAPYSTDFAVNPFTYGASNNVGQISEPHGIGFIFATVLWDLNWALIDQYGGIPDPNLHTGTGGNNIAMNLVIEALKIQPCSPGMVDGRDAILLADQSLYNGTHQCLIWNVFANRGLGFSANQGSPLNRTDQIEAFDLPPSCQAIPPVADFNIKAFSSCRPLISFSDNSNNLPQTWFWNFGDGNTSTQQNPRHRYSSIGTYNVKLVVSNNTGIDSTTQSVTINNLQPSPIANDLELCLGDTATLTATATGLVYWRDTSQSIVHIGDTLTIPNVNSPQTFYAESGTLFYPLSIGPINNSVGFGAYHNAPYHGALNFTAERNFEIQSAWVNANGAGPRTFYLAKGAKINGAPPTPGSIVEQVTLNLVDGPQRIDLGFLVPKAGNYYIGSGSNVNLYRNNTGINYPYTINGLLDIYSSSAIGPDSIKNWYYLYDIRLRAPQCISLLDTVRINPVISDFSFVGNNGTINFIDASTGATNWFWDFGDNTNSTLSNPMHTYSSSGNYVVSLSINNGACVHLDTVSVLVGTKKVQKNIPNIKLLPNPSDGRVQLILNQPINEDLSVHITDISGKTIQQTRIPTGDLFINLNLSNFPSGVYVVHVVGTSFSEVRKLIIE